MYQDIASKIKEEIEYSDKDISSKDEFVNVFEWILCQMERNAKAWVEEILKSNT